MTGRVIQTTGSWYQVLAEGKVITCRLKGKFKLSDLDTTNPLAVGDFVVLEQTENGEFVIAEILPRENYIIRQSPRQKHQRHILASNINQAILVATISKPRTSLGFIDRFICSAASFHIPVVIIINKVDLHTEKDKRQLEYMQQVYPEIGIPVLALSAQNPNDILQFHDLLQDKTSLIAGHSGVGKSTLLNALNPDLNLKTGKISEKWNKGMHTTTFATMFEVFDNSFVIDTPGIKEFANLHIEPEEVSGYFSEINKYAESCQYNNCMHVQEPNCAVIKAVEEGKIALTRYENYLNILQDIKEVNYWERK